jgi:hypothetical protein
VDAAYKFDLKEMNELNYARFEAKLEQLRAELRAEVAKLEARIDLSAAPLRESLEKALRDQMRFFFLAWATLLGGIIALWFR